MTIPVAAGETVYLGAEDGFDAQIGRVDAAPGAMLPVTVSTTTGEEQALSSPSSTAPRGVRAPPAVTAQVAPEIGSARVTARR